MSLNLASLSVRIRRDAEDVQHALRHGDLTQERWAILAEATRQLVNDAVELDAAVTAEKPD